ncbi:MAG: hypothetical protein IKL14_05555 [Alphaproteobacteria bacterium]|nr:hypothetical protein [Alphaproteobacteria bacterium]
MKNIYFVFYALGALFLAYFSGLYVGTERAKRISAELSVDNQMQIFKIQENVNAETFNRGTDDIRNSLRKKYSIAD